MYECMPILPLSFGGMALMVARKTTGGGLHERRLLTVLLDQNPARRSGLADLFFRAGAHTAEQWLKNHQPEIRDLCEAIK